MDSASERISKTRTGTTLFVLFYKYGTMITIVLLTAFFGAFAKGFLEPQNIVNILRSISIVTIIAVGVTVSLAVGGFDLSVGSVASVADALVMSLFVWYGFGFVTAVLVTLAVAVLIGLFNAFLVTKIKTLDMLVTLAAMFVFQGIAQTYTHGASISENMVMATGTFAKGKLPAAFKILGQVPLIIIVMLVIVLLAHIFLTFTKHGRYLYMIGGNREAARLSGIAVNRYRTLAYVLSAVLAATGGLILAARVQTAEINAGSPYLMDSVAAAYIGFSIAGNGKPNAIGTLLGSVLLGVLSNGLVIMSVPYYAMDIVKGAVLFFALALTYYRRGK